MKLIACILIGVFIVVLIVRVYLIDKYKEREIENRVRREISDRKFQAELSNVQRIEWYQEELRKVKIELDTKTFELENAMNILRKYQSNEFKNQIVPFAKVITTESHNDEHSGDISQSVKVYRDVTAMQERIDKLESERDFYKTNEWK